MAAPMVNMFCVATERILNSWTVLKLAVSHGMGGQDSEAKAEWMVHAIDQWFTENSNLEVYEVEEFLADILNHEFDTIADDGSLKEIATMLCGFHKLCQSGDEEKVREKLAQLPQASTQNSVQLASNSQEYDQENGDDDDDGGGGGEGPSRSNIPISENKETTQSENNDSMETDEDGWKVVQRGKRK